jgi:hypothetical protein
MWSLSAAGTSASAAGQSWTSVPGTLETSTSPSLATTEPRGAYVRNARIWLFLASSR